MSKGKKIIKKSISQKPPEEKAEIVHGLPDTDKSTLAYPILVKRLRDIALIVRGGDNWIRQISDSHLITVHDLLLRGVHPEIITEKARMWGYYVSPTNKSDLAAVTLFKKQLIKGTIHEIDPQTPDELKIRKGIQTRALQLMNDLDPIALMVETVKIQRERVLMGHDAEIADEQLNHMLSAEIATLNRMTSDLIDKFQRLGIMPEKPIEHVVTLNNDFSGVMSVLGTDGQNKMLSIAEKFLKGVSSAVVEMEVDADGNFVAPDNVPQ